MKERKEPVFICECCDKECEVEKIPMSQNDEALYNRSDCCGGLAYTVQEEE